MTETTVFQSGNSQAVRLPKDFRFKSKTVEIFRRGNEVVLREKVRTLGELLDSLPPVTEEMAREIDEMMKIIKQPQPEAERDWVAFWGDDAQSPVVPPKKAAAQSSGKAAAKQVSKPTSKPPSKRSSNHPKK
jgi:antitoxin VapB